MINAALRGCGKMNNDNVGLFLKTQERVGPRGENSSVSLWTMRLWKFDAPPEHNRIGILHSRLGLVSKNGLSLVARHERGKGRRCLSLWSVFLGAVPFIENRGGEGRGEGERRGREKERRRRFRKSDSFMKSIRVLLAVSRLFPLTYEMF